MAMLSDATRLVWFESPINPTLRCVDVAAIAAACRARGVISVIDNTFASPINQQPIALGVDLVMHSATKYLNGHSDVTAGALAGPARLIEPIEKARRLVGGVLDPYAAYALGRGLKTLDVRMQRHNANAMAVARWLVARQPRRPGLLSRARVAPGPRARARGRCGASAAWSASISAAASSARRASSTGCGLIKRAASLGGIESLCSLPVLTSQWGHSDEELARAGVTQGMARLSIGLEDPEDLIADLDQALER